MSVDEEIRIGWTSESFEVELHDESLSGNTLVKFKSADSIDEVLKIAREWMEG